MGNQKRRVTHFLGGPSSLIWIKEKKTTTIGGIWFHDEDGSTYFDPIQYGIHWDERSDTFWTDVSLQHNCTWLLYVDPLGKTLFFNTNDRRLSFYYEDCLETNWRYYFKGDDDPAGFNDSKDGFFLTLSDLYGDRNWNRIVYKGRTYWINVDDTVFLFMLKRRQFLRDDDPLLFQMRVLD